MHQHRKETNVWRDPVTGDQLTRGEYLSWIVQGIIRRWTFLGIITLITAIIWLTNDSVALTWWNLGASYLALVIESIVGISMFAQTRRDAVALREVRAISQRVEKMSETQKTIMDAILSLVMHEKQEIELIEHKITPHTGEDNPCTSNQTAY